MAVLPDAVKEAHWSHVVWESFRQGPLEVVHDWNYVASSLNGSHNFLSHDTHWLSIFIGTYLLITRRL